jgi:hypothetical protein
MRRTFFLLFCAVMAVAAARPASAGQEAEATPSGTPAPDSLTRAALLAAAREQKALEPKPVERSTVEKGLYWYDNQYLLRRSSGSGRGSTSAAATSRRAPARSSAWPTTTPSVQKRNLERANRFDVNGVAARSTRGYQRYGGG